MSRRIVAVMTKALRACILSVGDELVTGLTVDTNSAYFSRELSSLGIEVIEHASVGDNQPAIEGMLRDLPHRCDFLLVSGGIGPTPDDLTRESLAAVMGEPLDEQTHWTEHLLQLWARRGRPMPEGNRKQATKPASATLLDNTAGTAAGIAGQLGACQVFIVPGVPKEAKVMFDAHVRPWAVSAVADRGGWALRTRALHTFGIGESDLAERLGDLLKRGSLGEDLDVGTTATQGVVSVRIYARSQSEQGACDSIDEVENRVRGILGDLVFGTDSEVLADAVARTLRFHKSQPIVSVAESCTGGLIAKLLTDSPGSSAHFHRGIVSYSNAAKEQLLGVPGELIAEHGAVSEPVAAAMARGVRALEGHGISLSVTGIAGPGGGTEAKPVGMVCIGLAAPGNDADSANPYAFTRTWHFQGDRDTIRLRSAYMALTLLRFHLLGYALDDIPI